MRIFITGTTGESLPPPYAGIPKHSLFLARNWRKSGHKVALSFVYKHDQEDDLGAEAEYFFEYSSKPNKFHKLIFLLKYFLRNPILYAKLLFSYLEADKYISKEVIFSSAYGVFLDRVVSKFKPDIILAETALIKVFMAGQIAKRRKIPFVIHTYAEVHDMSMSPNKRLKSHPIKLKYYWNYFLNIADLIISPSCYCARGPKTYLSEDKVKMIYFGIDVDKYSDFSENKMEARKTFNLPADKFIVIAVGALSPRKGHDHLIKASAILQRKGSPIHVVLCGPGDSQWLKTLAKEEKVEDQVSFFTDLSEKDLIRLYKASDLYCDASNTVRACLGMSLTEAMAVGMPVVIYDAGGMPEVVFDGKNGFSVPTNDIKALAHALNKVKNLSKKEYEFMGQESVKVAKSMVDINKESNDTLIVLKEIVNSYRK